MLDNDFFLNKKVLITGCTGFKGSWLTIWLDLLGAKLYGLALDPPTKPSIFQEAKLNNIIDNNIIDIKDTTVKEKKAVAIKELSNKLDSIEQKADEVYEKIKKKKKE